MSAATIAARPSAALPRVPFGLVALALVFAVGIGTAIGANAFRPTAAPAPLEAGNNIKHHSAFPAAPAARSSAMAEYRQIVANLAAAEERHDYAALAGFRKQLDRVLTSEVVGALYLKHERLSAQLAASGRDARAATIARELQTMCDAKAVKAKLDFCN
jgi:hypothetical protein